MAEWDLTETQYDEAHLGEYRYCHYHLGPKQLFARLEKVHPKLAAQLDGRHLGADRGVWLAGLTDDERAALTAAEMAGAPEGSVPDCLVVPLAPPTVGDLTPDLASAEDDFKRGAIVLVTSNGAALQGNDVRVAVIDNSPTVPTADEGAHGRAMRAIIEFFACPEPAACRVDVRSYRGLPRRYDASGNITNANDTQGGQFGFQSDVALAVDHALSEWSDLPSPRPRLIINLSLGWEPQCPGNGDVLRQSLAEAAEQGALILAAAGNRPAGTCARGATGPGNWLDQPVVAASGQTVPLLYAITALDRDGGPLASFREGSNTPYAARGHSAVISDQRGTYGPLSGSSVATAIASGTAARTWSILPALGTSGDTSAAVVMAILHDEGDPTGVTADVFFPTGSGPAPEQRVVDTCRAVARACNEADACEVECNAPAPIGPSGIEAAIGMKFAETEVTELSVDVEVVEECSWCPDTVATTTVIGNATGPALPNPWVIPQPGDTACSICGLSGTKLYVLLSDFPAGASLLSTTLSFVGDDGVTLVRQYDAEALPAQPNVPYILEDQGLWALTSVAGMRASIHLTFGGSSPQSTVSFSETLPIFPPGA